LPTGVFTPTEQGGDEADGPLHRRFQVAHPLHILAHFVCFRSCLRSLCQGQPICYITPGPDGRVNAVDASVPEFLFLKRSDDTSGIGLIPYTPYQSVFDYTLGEVKSSLWVSDEYAVGEGVDSLCGLTERTAYTRADRAGDDASQLTSLGTIEVEHHSCSDHTHGLYRPFYRGFALDLANSMRTSTSNKQFRKVLSSILPLVCTMTTDMLYATVHHIMDVVADIKVGKHDLQRRKPDPDKCLTFRQCPSIIHTEPVDARDYDNYMHQHLAVLSRKTATSTGTGRGFIYYYNTRAIANTVEKRMAHPKRF
jgi:hypothetical protein